MKAQLEWSEGMKFKVTAGQNSIMTDGKSPLGQDSALTPKELMISGLAGCTAMDVVALLKKHKQVYQKFTVHVEVDPTKGTHPVVFTAARLVFDIEGEVEPAILLESIKLSQTKYCGVSAMLSKAFPISYSVILNQNEIGNGKAEFNL